MRPYVTKAQSLPPGAPGIAVGFSSSFSSYDFIIAPRQSCPDLPPRVKKSGPATGI